MTRKHNEENERMKRAYAHYLRAASGRDMTTVDKAIDAILRFERSTNFKSFKLFHIEQAMKFKDHLAKERNARTGKPLSKSTIDGTLRAVKGFFLWLAGQTGYKSRLRYSDAEYFNNNAKDARAAHAQRPAVFPSMEQCTHAFRLMPCATPIERRNKALFAFLMITGARDGAIASLRIKHIDLAQGCVFQDGRDVKTKFSKTFQTFFVQVGGDYEKTFIDWVEYLKNDLLFGYDDALFPKPKIAAVDGSFAVVGFDPAPYASASAIREVIKSAFTTASLPPFAPHSFRKTLVKWADTHYQTREGFKAFSQNIGHDSVATTVGAYFPVSQERQAQIIRGLA
jgi:integrase/recombinase XerD